MHVERGEALVKIGRQAAGRFEDNIVAHGGAARSYVRFSGFGNTRKIAMISPFTSILLTSVALNPRLSPGLTSLHPLPVFIFCPRGTFDRIFVFAAIYSYPSPRRQFTRAVIQHI
jgi:hypothetical protein